MKKVKLLCIFFVYTAFFGYPCFSCNTPQSNYTTLYTTLSSYDTRYQRYETYQKNKTNVRRKESSFLVSQESLSSSSLKNDNNLLKPVKERITIGEKSIWTAENNDILYNGTPIYLRAMSWFGFETQDFVVNGLWTHSLEWYFQLLKRENINAIRIPFSAEWIHYNIDKYPLQAAISADPSLQNKKSIEILDDVFENAKKYGILILLDLHRLHKEYISELWYSPYDSDYPTTIFFQTWFAILDRYHNHTQLLGIDLLNEPHGRATFGSGDRETDWRLFVEDAIPQFLDRYNEDEWLFFIEGIEWGHTFKNYPGNPFSFPDTIQKRIIFSPHVYGKSVVPSTNMDPNVLHQVWHDDFGFLIDDGKTVVPGEWGGKVDIDSDWMSIFTDYLISHRMTNNFLWSLGPNSGDVAGYLLDDWTTIDNFKRSMLQKVQPQPTIFS